MAERRAPLELARNLQHDWAVKALEIAALVMVLDILRLVSVTYRNTGIPVPGTGIPVTSQRKA